MVDRLRPKTRPKPPPLSPRKRLALGLIASVLPLVFVLLVETALRLRGYGGYPPLFRKLGRVPGGQLVLAVQGGAESWFFGKSQRAGTSEQYTFVDPKPTNTLRVMLVGESAIQGYPEPRHLCASAFLQRMLEDAWPQRRVEVINLGTTAIASFPVLGILTEALNYQPDLVVVYAGHNEFFGTYGVASVGLAGTRPWMLRTTRWVHSLAIVQVLQKLRHHEQTAQNRTLMEDMMARSYISPDDWRRRAAENMLYENVSQMIRRSQAKGSQILVCAPPTNERGLAPIGNDEMDGMSSEKIMEVKALLLAAESKNQTNSAITVSALLQLLQLYPKHARAHYLLGQVYTAQGRHAEALKQYESARDLDTMPWRAPAASINAIRRAAQERKVPICDVAELFREQSPGHAIGWALMDDHVHPTLRGQALIAEAIVGSLSQLEGPLHLTSEARARLANWQDYAHRLGTNIYDQYAVAHNMRLVFSAPFMRLNNDNAFVTFNKQVDEIENRLAPEVREVLHEWQATRPYGGSRCPITAAVAQLRLRQDHYQESLDLYEIAQHAVPSYTSWFLEYTYYKLFCRLKLNGALRSAEKQEALEAIEQGRFLCEHHAFDNEFTKRYTGLLHILRDEFSPAIPWLLSVEEQQTGIDRLALDQALFVCYLRTHQLAKARDLLTMGAAASKEYAAHYKALLGQLARIEAASSGSNSNASNAPPGP